MVASAETMRLLEIEQKAQASGNVPEGERIGHYAGQLNPSAPILAAKPRVPPVAGVLGTVAGVGAVVGVVAFLVTSKAALSVALGLASGTAAAVLGDRHMRARKAPQAPATAPCLPGSAGDECRERQALAAMVEGRDRGGCPPGFHAGPRNGHRGQAECLPDETMTTEEMGLRDPAAAALKRAREMGLNTVGLPVVPPLTCTNEGGRIVCRDPSGRIQAIDGMPEPLTDLLELFNGIQRKMMLRDVGGPLAEPAPAPAVAIVRQANRDSGNGALGLLR